MDNKFYGIGVGVGDPDQITLKAIKTLKKLDVVILPEAKKDMGSTAYSIAKEYLKEDVELVFMEFPMLKNPLDRIEGRKANTRVVEKLLDEGKNVGFLTIGDTMTYSTYVYILEHLDKKYEVETIPGISSFADISSRFTPPKVGDILTIVSTISSVSFVFNTNGNASTSAKFLNSILFPSITGNAAKGPISPKPKTAVPSDTTATVFHFLV